jgi:glutamyl endopeptidase
VNAYETDMAVLFPSELDGSQLVAYQNRFGRFTRGLRTNMDSPVDDSLIGKGVGDNLPAEIIPLLNTLAIDSVTGEITFSNNEEPSRQLLRIEAVVGDDDRALVPNTKAWPWSVHGALISTFPNGRAKLGTGTLVNEHHVVTAGHNVYRPKLGGWAIGCKFIPGRNVAPGVTVANQTPFGEANGSRMISVKGWTRDLKKECDYAMVILDKDIGKETGWFGIASITRDILVQHIVNISGYPANKGGHSLYTHSQKISLVSDDQIGYPADTSPGQSGSGAWVYKSDFIEEPKVVAIHNYGDMEDFKENISTRINENVFDNLTRWMSIW